MPGAVIDVGQNIRPLGEHRPVGAVVASSDGVPNFKMVRLFTMEEVISIRQKRI
jgi:hypothetical protein